MNLYLLQYNNYYNRLVKREEGISAYLDYVVYGPQVDDEYGLTNIDNWYPGDGVNAQQVVNTPAANYDYLLVVDELGNIDSRWFVVEAVKNTYNQFVLSLHRDVLADYYDIAMNSPCYIERAMVSSTNNFIYNSENMLFNQIKKSEILLADKSRCPWIVGYIADNAFDKGNNLTEDLTIEATLDGKQIEESLANAIDSRFSKEELLSWAGLSCGTLGRTVYVAEGLNAGALIPVSKYGFKFGDETEAYKGERSDQNIMWGAAYIGSNGANSAQRMTDSFNANANIRSNAHLALKTIHGLTDKFISADDVQWLKNHQNMVLKDSSGNYFSIAVESTGTKELSMPINSSSGAAFVDVMAIIKPFVSNYNDIAAQPNCLSLYADYSQLKVNVKAVLTKTFTTTIKSNVRKLIDAPYRMFAIPYPVNGEEWAGAARYTEIYTDAAGTQQDEIGMCLPNAEASMNLAMDIARSLGSKLYDLQLLPYNPITDIDYSYFGVNPVSFKKKFLQLKSYLKFDATTGKTIDTETDHTVISPAVITKDDPVNGKNYELATYVMWAKTSSFSLTIRNYPEVSDNDLYTQPASIPFVSVPTNATEFKVEHETAFYRLTSPNYSGVFEFKATSNRGIDYFEVDATYKPYSPYVKISPRFGGLYGGDFDDARGLILGGNFSLPTLGDAWEQYQINNKSYLDSFNAQITNMENTYKLQNLQAKEAANWGAFGAGISGAGTGAMVGSVGGPWGAAIGAAVGSLSSAVSAYGASRDLYYAQELQEESKRYAREQFNLSLQNIQALPYSLNRVSAYDKNNKYFPFLEYYTSTDAEKEALRQKIKYTSMTINAMGTPLQYKQATPSFIQAQLVRIEDYVDEESGTLIEFHDDYHIATAIAAELHKGFYV